MNVEKLKATRNIQMLGTLFLVGDVFYATESFHVMNGKFGWARKIFDENKKYLGMIDRDDFPDKQVEPFIQ